MSNVTQYEFPNKPINRFGWLGFLSSSSAFMQSQSSDSNFYRFLEPIPSVRLVVKYQI